MNTTRIAVAAALLACGLASTACSQRYIVDIVDHESGKTSLLLTHDVMNFAIVKVEKEVFWDCAPDNKGTLQCTRACDRKDEQGAQVLCPALYKAGWQ